MRSRSTSIKVFRLNPSTDQARAEKKMNKISRRETLDHGLLISAGTFLSNVKKGKVCIRTKRPIKPELILVSVA